MLSRVWPAGRGTRSDRANSLGGLVPLFIPSSDDEGPNVEFYGQLMQRELEDNFGGSFRPYLSGTFDLTGLSVLEDPEERQEQAAVELEHELEQALRLLRRLLDSVHRQGAARGGANEEAQK